MTGAGVNVQLAFVIITTGPDMAVAAARVHVRAIKMEGGDPKVTAGRQSVRGPVRGERERTRRKGSWFVCPPAISSLGIAAAAAAAAAARLPAGG